MLRSQYWSTKLIVFPMVINEPITTDEMGSVGIAEQELTYTAPTTIRINGAAMLNAKQIIHRAEWRHNQLIDVYKLCFVLPEFKCAFIALIKMRFSVWFLIFAFCFVACFKRVLYETCGRISIGIWGTVSADKHEREILSDYSMGPSNYYLTCREMFCVLKQENHSRFHSSNCHWSNCLFRMSGYQMLRN